MDLPLRVLITRPSAVSQAWFAREAVHAVVHGPTLGAEPRQDGLVLRGLTEADLELAYLELKKKFEDIRYGNPSVEYLNGETFLEPYYSATVDTPEYFMGSVVGDLNSRRATILNITDIPGGKRIQADVPVAECLGYSTALRRIARRRAEYTFEFAGYRPARGRPDPNNVV
jgi:predicted membrane GTPase involved in stress response